MVARASGSSEATYCIVPYALSPYDAPLTQVSNPVELRARHLCRSARQAHSPRTRPGSRSFARQPVQVDLRRWPIVRGDALCARARLAHRRQPDKPASSAFRTAPLAVRTGRSRLDCAPTQSITGGAVGSKPLACICTHAQTPAHAHTELHPRPNDATHCATKICPRSRASPAERESHTVRHAVPFPDTQPRVHITTSRLICESALERHVA